MKKILCIIILMPVFVKAQTGGGIAWATGLSWEEVKEKARKENKHIFLDIFATWCGPCKDMDKYVYPNDTVGTFFNEKFISVKVQMDKTKNDPDAIRAWYKDAEGIGKKYHVAAFPTYIFLAPDGQLTHVSKGYQPVSKFVSEAKIAVKPGQVYANQYEEYETLMAQYHSGIKNYDRMIYMINTAIKVRDNETFKLLMWDYIPYLESVDSKTLYTKENIWFMSRRLGPKTLKSRPKLFDVFASNSKKVDKVMGLEGYADNILSRVIFQEIAVPEIGVKQPLMVRGIPPIDSAEADWGNLYKKISDSFNSRVAERALLDVKIAWYESHFNYPLFAKAYVEKLERYGIDTVSDRDISDIHPLFVNMKCWSIFEKVADPQLLNRVADQMRALIRMIPGNYQYIDTYANLLYRAGRKDEAVSWQEKAIAMANEKQSRRSVELYGSVLAKMRSGEPTWPVRKK